MKAPLYNETCTTSCDWQDNILVPTIPDFELANKNLSTILNPKGKSVYKKISDEVLEEIGLR